MYLRLLVARQAIRRVLADAERGESLSGRLKALDAQIAQSELSDDLRRSLNSQADILRQRLAQQTEARQKLAFLDAELTRIQEQAELIREQAALSTDPEILSQRIDEIAATLGGTSQWIRDQQKVYGAMEDLLSEPPPLATSIRVRESQ
jgi:DNA mismatch repair ATPase MutS